MTPKTGSLASPSKRKGWNAFLPEGEVNVAVGYQEVVQKLLPNYGGAFFQKLAQLVLPLFCCLDGFFEGRMCSNKPRKLDVTVFVCSI